MKPETLPTFQKNPIIIIALITAVCLVGDSMLYVVLPTHFEEAGLTSLWQVGILLSINRLVRLPLNPLIGWLYTKISARTGVLIAVLLAFGTTLSYGLIQGFIGLLIARCFWGVAWGFLRLGAYFTILEYATDATRGKSMGLYNGLYRLGSLVGMLIGGFLADFYGLTTTSVIFSLVTLCALPVVFIVIKPTSQGMVAHHVEDERHFSLWSNRTVLSVLGIGMFFALIYQGIVTSTLSYLINIHNGSVVLIFGCLIGASSLAGILQAIRWGFEPFLAPLFGSLTDGKAGRYPLLLISTLLASILFALVSFDLPLWLWIGVLLLLQATATSLTTIADALAADTASNGAKIKIMTTYSLLIDFGAALGPMLAYVMNQFVHPYASFWFASLILLGTTLVCAKRWLKQK
ncbi:MFS transporter [Sulfurospirillum multivorans]|uniref:MFS family protein n=2 Tax=Sulfurospirillum multivorans TaxID=66821 RepID=A0AA86ANI3_SULMK|nr:MFS transporter [Sulfurospirillum multivorans]AHJ12862.1 MFS family protein [Sulfurospirillum multivorans DSM 12446]QEH06353.1 MFS family protein [Sulfurospirillum multivorans]